ncbi:hypothetical protein UY3_12978 [Chelonia mydas]|uniref:Uncharacterized protein n=1 Tax=Chelonia mydas TaxID=8469 RepID=M7BCL6_CHEMY|nr:hypothetical protein UY3_12978 [Chelonia mydas]
MPKSPDFKPCKSCSKPMPTGDPHDSCLKRLGEAHQAKKCRICKGFCPRTKKEWDFRLKHLPASFGVAGSSTKFFGAQRPGSSSGSSTMGGLWPRPAALLFPAPKPVASTWHRSHSPALKRHWKQEKSGSPSQRPIPLELDAVVRPREEHPGAVCGHGIIDFGPTGEP